MAPIPLDLVPRRTSYSTTHVVYYNNGGAIGGGIFAAIIIIMLVIFLCVFIYEHNKGALIPPSLIQSLTNCSATSLRRGKVPGLEKQNTQRCCSRSRDFRPYLPGLLRRRQKNYSAKEWCRRGGEHTGISAGGPGRWRVRACADAFISASNGLYIPTSNGLHANFKCGAGSDSVKGDKEEGGWSYRVWKRNVM
jgi:hypothetical protein